MRVLLFRDRRLRFRTNTFSPKAGFCLFFIVVGRRINLVAALRSVRGTVTSGPYTHLTLPGGRGAALSRVREIETVFYVKRARAATARRSVCIFPRKWGGQPGAPPHWPAAVCATPSPTLARGRSRQQRLARSELPPYRCRWSAVSFNIVPLRSTHHRVPTRKS